MQMRKMECNVMYVNKKYGCGGFMMVVDINCQVFVTA